MGTRLRFQPSPSIVVLFHAAILKPVSDYQVPSIELGEDLIERVVLAVIGTLDAYAPAPLAFQLDALTTGEAARVLEVAQATVKAQLAH
jgi:hypothetical protein